MIEELLYEGREKLFTNLFYFKYRFLIILSLLKEDFPWIYYLGKELINMLGSNKLSKNLKYRHIEQFLHILEEDASNRMRIVDYRGDYERVFYELPRILKEFAEKSEFNMENITIYDM